MKPTLDLARELASAALDQVERDRALHDVRIAEAILARMVVCEAREAAAPSQAGDDIAKLARALLDAMQRDTKIRDVSDDTMKAYSALMEALPR